jgi:hypothetical protein
MDHQINKAVGNGLNLAMSNQGYQGMQQGAIAGNMPRELGIIDRVQGLNGGISELYGRLSSLIERVDGSDTGGVVMPASTKLAPGLTNVLSEAEANLRGCMELLGQLNAKL